MMVSLHIVSFVSILIGWTLFVVWVSYGLFSSSEERPESPNGDEAHRRAMAGKVEAISKFWSWVITHPNISQHMPSPCFEWIDRVVDIFKRYDVYYHQGEDKFLADTKEGWVARSEDMGELMEWLSGHDANRPIDRQVSDDSESD